MQQRYTKYRNRYHRIRQLSFSALW